MRTIRAGLIGATRLHVSTWVVVLFCLVLAILVEVPGNEVVQWVELGEPSPDGSSFSDGGYGALKMMNHGWPISYLRRIAEKDFDPDATWNPAIWSLCEGVYDFQPGALATDVVAAGIAVVAIGSMAELRRRRRKWTQFTLRESLVSMSIVALGAAWLAHQRTLDRKTSDHLRAVQSDSIFNYDRKRTPRLPLWLRDIVSDRFLVALGVNAPGGTSLDWTLADHEHVSALLGQFPDDIIVQLTGDESDADLATFTDLRGIRNLMVLTGSDRILDHIGCLTRLRTLFVKAHSWEAKPLSDRAFAQLGNLTELTNLSIEFPITDAGISHLEGLSDLEFLSLEGPSVTERGLTVISAFTQLRQLTLRSFQLNDATMQRISRLNRLWSLDLQSSHFTEDGFRQLNRLPELFMLILGETKISPSVVAELKRTHPNLAVMFRPSK